MLTPAQQATLKTYIEADQEFNVLVPSNGSALTIADTLNLLASPTFTLWKTAVVIEEIMRNGMDWVRVDNLSVGKARIWDWLSRLGTFDASKPNIRAGIDAAWVGSAPDLAVRAAIYVHCKRAAARGEKIFATGTGSDAVPAVASFEGKLTYLDVVFAMGWPN